MNAPENQLPPEPPVAFAPPPLPARKLHWPWFTAALLLPAILTYATTMSGSQDAPIACALFGAGLSGLVCGILLGRRIGKSPGAVVGLSILFIGIFAVASFALCFGGCIAGNYQLNMH
jgi:FtsH-binding integral membrane protein